MLRSDTPTELDEARIEAYLPKCPPRDSLLIVLGFNTGLRISELLSLKVGDVSLGGVPRSVLRVPRRNLKGGRGVHANAVRSRSIPINQPANEAIGVALAARHNALDSEPLFRSRKGGRSLTRRQACRIIRDTFRAAGLDPSRVWSAHSLRRRYARRIFDTTGNIEVVRNALSHRWVTTTQAYVGLGEEDAAAAIVALGVRSTRHCVSPESDTAENLMVASPAALRTAE